MVVFRLAKKVKRLEFCSPLLFYSIYPKTKTMKTLLPRYRKEEYLFFDTLLFILFLIIIILCSCHHLELSHAEEDKKPIEIMSFSGTIQKIAFAEWKAFTSKIEGEIIDVNNENYEAARTIWNTARANKKPALIIQSANKEDVIQTIKFAKKNDLLLSVRGGGHNSAGFAMNDKGMVLDLSQMKEIILDPPMTTVYAGPGITWGELDQATQQYGLATTGAIISQVGIGGFTLGGGLGWLHRSYGSGSDNLISAEVVTAEGILLRASREENPDLFWAIRGGGGNFGVVTSFQFQLHQVGPEILAGLLFFPIEEAKEIIPFYQDYIETIPDELSTWLMFRKAPATPFLTDELYQKPIMIMAIVYNGPISEGEKWAKPLRTFKKPLVDLVKERRYVDWQSSLDDAWGNGFHNLWKGHYFMEISEPFLDSVIHYIQIASPHSDIKIQHLEGVFGRVGENETAFGNRNSRFGLVIQTRWEGASETPTQLAWTEGIFKALQPLGTGKVYVNFMDNEGEERVKDAYNTSSFEKLQRIKQKYDPTNFFRKNQNIKPR